MFGKGKIDIAIKKTNYAPGDTISGDVTLALKKPLKASELSISLIGEYTATRTVSRAPDGLEPEFDPKAVVQSTPATMRFYESKGAWWGSERVTSNVQIGGSRQQLDGENEYVPGREYRFDIKIDKDTPTGPVKWYLLAKLDIPHGSVISKKVEVTIR
jgi:hypothetical protein